MAAPGWVSALRNTYIRDRVTTYICYCARHTRRRQRAAKSTRNRHLYYQSTCAAISIACEKAEKSESAPCGYRVIYEHLSTTTTLHFSVALHLVLQVRRRPAALAL
jgi:hypothetical protein